MSELRRVDSNTSVNGVSSRTNTNKTKTTTQNSVMENNKTATSTKPRLFGYDSAHKDVEKNKKLATELYKAINGPGTDTDAMKKTFESINKYNVIEVLQEYETIAGEDFFKAIEGDFSTYGGGQTDTQDDCKPFIDKIYFSMKDRAADLMKNGSDEIDDDYTWYSSNAEQTWDFCGLKPPTITSAKHVAQNIIEAEKVFYGEK